MADVDDVREIVEEIAEVLRGVYGDAADEIVEAFSLELDWTHVDENAIDYALERAAELVGKKWEGDVLVDNPNPRWAITETARERIHEIVNEGLQEGWSMDRVADALDESGAYGEARAEMIARTEVGTAQNVGQAETMREAGVDRVYVYDGESADEPEGGWGCACDEMNGEVWTVAYAMEHPLEHPNAVFAGTRVLPLGGVSASYAAEWRGPAVRVATAMGNLLTVSPNHPVLTGRGWVAAKGLRVGDHVVSRCGSDGLRPADDLDLDNAPPLVENVADALRLDGLATRRPASAADLHGDGCFCQGDIEVVRANGLLSGMGDVTFIEEPHELVLARAGVKLKTFPGNGAKFLRLDAVPLPAPGGMGGPHVGGAGADGDAAAYKPVPEDAVADPGFLGEMANRFAIRVSLDEVVDVAGVAEIVAHAFDLTTQHHTYFAGNLLVHNCTRAFSPVPSSDPTPADRG